MHGIKSALLEYVKDGRTIKNVSRWLYDTFDLKIDTTYLSGYLAGCGLPQTPRSEEQHGKLVKVFNGLEKSDPDGMTVVQLMAHCRDAGVTVSNRYIYGYASGCGYPLTRSSHGEARVRKDTVLSLKKSGLTYSEIGDMLGVTRQRAHDIAKSSRRPTNRVRLDSLP